MTNLIKILTPIVLVGAGLIGCATSSPTLPSETAKPNTSQIIPSNKSKGIDLRNGFFAESYNAADIIDLIASIRAGEVTLQKIEGVYEATETRIYHTTPSDKWNTFFDKVCYDADNSTPYFFISEEEAWTLLDRTYEKINNDIQWTE